ncbi:hypothetical protein QWT87_15920 [Chryseobacterium sp. APV1]|uniref:Tetratricopeptide repeat protein n=1 Tax=Chryseobacterium urinae TaxID=3058400 RepID=A0ABT8U9Q6_9FLAO|nr:hypothetical protein [Chryseobacterium sp. APV1]MDO3426368.1 hypothetical protein [Chryseobacterium sp. APV1]
MITRKLFVSLLITFGLSLNAQMKLNESKYNKFIKGEKYSEALAYLKEKGGVNNSNYWFTKDAQQLATFCFDPNFDDNKYDIIINYVNNCFKGMDNQERGSYDVANCYLIKTNYYLWKNDYQNAALAYKESLERLDKFKKENDINPEYIKMVKSVIDRYYFNQIETHKMEQIIRNFDVSSLNFSEEQAFKARQEIKKILTEYDKPRKVHFIDYENNSTINKGLSDYYFTMGDFFNNYFKVDFFYNMPKKVKNQYFSTINVNYLLDDEKFKTKEEETQQTEQRKAALIKKYGKTFGEAVFNSKIIIGMTKAMLEEGFNKPRSIDVSEYSEYWTWSDVMISIDKKTQKVTHITDLR